MRSAWGSRLVAAFLVVALLPASVVPVVAATPHVAAFSYAAWLRAQLARPATPAVDAALDAAVDAAPSSIDTFLEAFAEAYAEAPDRVPLADLFEAPGDLTADALLSFLRSRFDRLGADVLSRSVVFVAAAAPHLNGPERVKALPASVPRPAATPSCPALDEASTPAVVVPVRALSAARPNGP